MKTNELLDIFERFGDNAQKALNFVRANSEKDGEAAAAPSDYHCTGNGVHIVYPDGSSWLFDKSLPKTPGMRVGICHDGHRWLIGTDYGDMKWSEASWDEIDDNGFGICKEYEVMFHWEDEAWQYRKKLGELWKHIPFKDDETMPTGAMVVTQEFYAKHGPLNEALRFCGMPEYEVGAFRWLADRYSENRVRTFNGFNGIIAYTLYDTSSRVQAVTLWK